MILSSPQSLLLFFTAAATAELYTLSLHDALPIFLRPAAARIGSHLALGHARAAAAGDALHLDLQDRKSTRLNSSHVRISYAVFCLKKKMTRYGTLHRAR